MGMDELPPTSAGALKGRGAITNAVGRYEGHDRVAVDDGWSRDDEDLPPLHTTVTVDATRTIIARNDSPDLPFNQSINPYRGCEHGCVYCFARPTHAYLGMSPGLDFETRLFAKPNAAKLLERELRAPRYECRMIAMGTNTDPYQPIERGMKVTRSILEVLSAYSHPVGIVTKSALVARDIDILAPMAARGLAQVFLSVTTLDPELARHMEPRASAPRRRIETIKALSDAGIPVGVMTAPMIPALNDKEMETILETAVAAGAEWAGYGVLRLPLEIKDLFREWLEAHYPDKAKHVLNLIRDMRDGKLNNSEFGSRMRGNGAYAELLARRFALAVKRLNLNRERFRLDKTQFAPPPRAGDQLSLL